MTVAILILAMWIPSTTNAPIITFTALYGFFSGAFVSMCNSVIAQITPDMSKIGVRTGTFYAIFSFAALASNPIGGALVAKWHGSYVGVQVFAGVMAFSGACCITAARLTLTGWHLVVKM